MKRRNVAILIVGGMLSFYGLGLLGQEAGAKKAPAEFKVKFETTAGDFVIEVHRDWAPIGADRFHELVSIGFYDEAKFFRVIPGFMAQCGIPADPKVAAKWKNATIKDDAVQKSNKRGFVTFAKSPFPNSRSTQFFINYADRNAQLDSQGFAPFGKVIEGMEIVDKLYGEYGKKREEEQPDQMLIQSQGNAYLEAKFPKLDTIKKATILEK